MTLFEHHTTASGLFRLPHLPLETDIRSLKGDLPALKPIQPGFALPAFCEQDAGKERMLDGLARAGRGNDSQSTDRLSIGALGQAGHDAEDGIAAQETDWEGKGLGWEALAERLNAEAGPSRPRTFQPMRTWDLADSKTVQNPYASEGGRGVFEAINELIPLAPTLPPLRSQSRSLPADPERLLALLIRATMGTTTTDLLEWDKKGRWYTWGSKGQRIEGYSTAMSATAVRDFLDIATSLRRLDEFLDRQNESPLTPTHHALFHAVSTYLTFIKERLTIAIAESEKEAASGWIQWQAALRDTGDLLKLLLEIMGWHPLQDTRASALPSRASSLLTHLYSQLLAQHQSSTTSATSVSLAYLLQAASRPLLSLLHAWIGLSDIPSESSTAMSDQPWADLGITRSPRKAHKMGIEDCWEYDFSSKRMPAFVPRDMRRSLFEAGKSLRLLREADARHPLSAGGWDIEGSWGWGQDFRDVNLDVQTHVKRINRETEHWRRSVRLRLRPLSGSASIMRMAPQRRSRKKIPSEMFDLAASPTRSILTNDHTHGEQTIMDDAAGQGGISDEKRLTDFLGMLNLAPGTHVAPKITLSIWTATPLDTLHSFLAYHTSNPLLPHPYPTFPLFISHHLLAPLLAHADLVSTALVQLYFDDLNFLDHLDILHAFWLGGDVGFSERVSAALFSTNISDQGTNMGRRARTRARMGLPNRSQGVSQGDGEWGIALGVGLSDRQRWPPGGAELAFALRTTLLEDDGVQTDAERGGQVWEEVQDTVSFAIRPIPEDEDGVRAKWLDPQAIEALDFLYLSYSPPQAISVLLPREILAKYQTIHNYLLRLCRVEAVIRSMYHDLHKPQDEAFEDIKSGVDAPRSRTKGNTASRRRQTIFSADPALESLVQGLRFRIGHFVSALTRYVVDTAIGVNWDRMRRRLGKLRRKDQTEGEKNSRPGTPFEDTYSDFGSEMGDMVRQSDNDDDNEVDGAAGATGPIHGLKSIHSLVVYHHLTLDKIMRACLISSSAGYDVASKLLMRLFGLILDLGKVVKEVEMRMTGLSEAKERIVGIRKEWKEKETVFMLAVDRLSRKASKERQAEEQMNDEAKDLETLLDGEKGDQTGPGQTNGLGELLMRLKLSYGANEIRKGRWDEDI